jgi:hypothetical protein
VAGIRRARRGRIAAGGAVAAQQVLDPVASLVPGQAAWKTVSFRNDLTLASVTVDYAPTAWGTTVEVRVGEIAAGTACQMLVRNSRGQDAIAGGWTVAAGNPAAWYPASSSFAASSVRSFEVTADGKTLVSAPAGPLAAAPRSKTCSTVLPVRSMPRRY